MSKRVQVKGSSATGKARPPSADRRASMVGAVAPVRYGTGWTATAHSTVSRIFAISGTIVRGPRSQFRPTTCAPSAARMRHASAYSYPSRVRPGCVGASVTMAGSPSS